jgi:hypothetical protein
MNAHRSVPLRMVALLTVLVASLGLLALAAPRAPAAATDDAPQGRLTAAEYRALLRSERLSSKIPATRSIKKSMALGKASCAALEKVETPLLTAEHAACVANVHWSSLATRLDHDACGSGESADSLGCLADLMGAAAAGTDEMILASGVVDQEVNRRSLPAVCARQLSMTQHDLRVLKRLARDMRAMEAALRSGDKKAIARAGKRFDKGYDTDASGDSGGVKRCPHAA